MHMIPQHPGLGSDHQLKSTSATILGTDTIPAWQRQHGAEWCARMKALITPAACDENQALSASKAGDLRCAGCGGLKNQKTVVVAVISEVSKDVIRDDEATIDPISSALMSILEEDATYADNAVDMGPEAAWVDDEDIDEEVLRLFPELRRYLDSEESLPVQEEVDSCRKRFRTVQPKHERYAVYRGRCSRCDGYMTYDVERHDGIKDDNVYRCYTCGWRTSPVYAWNRLHFVPGRLFR